MKITLNIKIITKLKNLKLNQIMKCNRIKTYKIKLQMILLCITMQKDRQDNIQTTLRNYKNKKFKVIKDFNLKWRFNKKFKKNR